jgi:hypothetical protein
MRISMLTRQLQDPKYVSDSLPDDVTFPEQYSALYKIIHDFLSREVKVDSQGKAVGYPGLTLQRITDYLFAKRLRLPSGMERRRSLISLYEKLRQSLDEEKDEEEEQEEDESPKKKKKPKTRFSPPKLRSTPLHIENVFK